MTVPQTSNGITLVALVVTVIVLIILAAVTINMIIGDNGIIRRAVEARDNWTKAEGNEQTGLTGLEQEMDELIAESQGGGDTSPVPVPPGYVISKVPGEDTIEGGLVIYEGTEDVTTSNHEESLTTRNQYVWIPVEDINDMTMCKEHGASKTLTFDGSIFTCSAGETNPSLAGKLYATSTGNNFTPSLSTQTYTQNSGLREPDLVTNYDKDTNASYLTAVTEGTEITSFAGLLSQMEADYKEMAVSVAKNGGFYISRYEVSLNGTTVESKKNKPAMSAGSASGNMWYGMYNKLRKTGTIKANMVWGSSYDQVMKFVNGKTDEEGNIYDVKTVKSSRHSGSIEVTGNNINDKVANIHDLEGNLREWTMEAYGTNNRVIRGGSYFNSESTAYRYNNDPYSTGTNLRLSSSAFLVDLSIVYCHN